MHRIRGLIVSLFLLAAGGISWAVAPLQAGKGSFVFETAQAADNKPLTVWYYKPAGLKPDARVLFVMHGVKRNGEKYRDDWIRYADQYKFLLIAPEFSEKYFPGDAYQFGNIKNPSFTEWSFMRIEQLFAELKQAEGLQADQYSLFGHSAGAQFVHRFMLFTPINKVDVAIAANAGTYTLPYYANAGEAGFPWSLDRKWVDENQLKAVFGRKLWVLLGEADIDPDHKHLSKKPAAMAEGANRLERGKRFFATAEKLAASLNTPLNWQLKTVPGVGHSDQGMAKAAARWLFEQR
ncbi:hypothetical protein [Parachitinimonas caeni]|uniref:Alpha/beta hydrolase n=1 Tax=Parachitinimonas caeni TaxID=3031301 RepID=A0ABT7DWY3_9NEIS|nr:hypothetical protein [Parachitinimonas caeni]MDK2124578.1 hypothetical protein [Parachitinimonas caeni]